MRLNTTFSITNEHFKQHRKKNGFQSMAIWGSNRETGRNELGFLVLHFRNHSVHAQIVGMIPHDER